MLPTLIASAPIGVPFLCPPGPGYAKFRIGKRVQTSRSFVAVHCAQPKEFKGLHTVSHAQRQHLKAGICAASLNARCAAAQTQTKIRESPTISVPFQGKQTPKLDDGGTGSPPKDRGGGGGGGGGGGSKSSGGFFLFGFLLIMSFLKEKEEEEYYRKRYGVYDT